jgi:hypothetical protein
VQDPKEELLIFAKNTLPRIAFATVENNFGTMFDDDLGNLSKRTDILAFLKGTTLNDITYSDIDSPTFFKITNSRTNSSITASNRLGAEVTCEIRAGRLRNFLNTQKSITPNLSIYDAITSGLKSPENSDLFNTMKNAFTLEDPAKQSGINPMSKTHFDLFTKVCLWKLQNAPLENIDTINLSENVDLQQEIWRDINMGLIYDTTEAITLFIQEIKEKSDELQKRGYTEAASAALALHEGLTQECKNLFEGKQSVPSFSKNCKKLIETAEESKLSDHRGFFGTILHGIKVALNAITFGAVSVTPTKSVAKLKAINSELQKKEVLPAPDESDDEPSLHM